MRKFKLSLALLAACLTWCILELPKVDHTTRCVKEALRNEGLLPKSGPNSPLSNYPQYDGISGLYERGDSDDVAGWSQSYPTYSDTRPNSLQVTRQNKISTFSIDVDTASYCNLRRYINDNIEPPSQAVRIEEMINYFPYEYPAPSGDAPVGVTYQLAACPWAAEKKLLRIGLQAKEVDLKESAPRNLVLLIDVSGSMESKDKLPLLKAALREFVATLNERDHLSLVTYAGSAGVVLPPTSGEKKVVIENAIANLESQGSTNGAQGILRAYDLARENFHKDSINRVLLATDGDFNVGLNSHEDLIMLIKSQRESGIYLTVLGLGRDNLNDHLMEQLADQGNGIYAYLDSLQEARRVLVEQAESWFIPVANDVKVQVEFNPAIVKSFRQVGYENRQLAQEDFTDDRKDAGEMGAGHQVTALYEIEFVGPTLPFLSFGEVRIRYKEPAGVESLSLSAALRVLPETKSSEMLFLSAVAETGLYLKHHPEAKLERIKKTLREADCSQALQAEFQSLVDKIIPRTTGL